MKYFLLKMLLLVSTLIFLFLVFDIASPLPSIIPLFIFIFILLDKKWMYQISIFIMGFYSILLGLLYLPFVLDRGEVNYDIKNVYFDISFMIFTIITLILYYLSQNEIKNHQNKKKYK